MELRERIGLVLIGRQLLSWGKLIIGSRLVLLLVFVLLLMWLGLVLGLVAIALRIVVLPVSDVLLVRVLLIILNAILQLHRWRLLLLLLLLFLELIALLHCWLHMLPNRRIYLNLFLFFIIQHIHKLLQDLLILTINTHINLLIILSQRLLFIPTSTHVLLAIVVTLISGWRYRTIWYLPFRVLSPLEVITIPISFTIHYWWCCVDDIRSEKVSNFPDVVRLEFLSIDWRIYLKIKIKEVFGPVILIHADVAKLKLYLDVIIGKKGWEFDQLISEVFNELIIDIGDPCL